MGNNTNGGAERRTFFRLVYESDIHAVFKINKNEFEIADISEGGIRLFNKAQYPFSPQVKGIVLFINGSSWEVNGNFEWQQNDQIGLSLQPFIPATIIENEKKFMILHNK